MIKYGFATFAKKVAPLNHPRRPFDIKKDLKNGNTVYVYVTPTGLVSKNNKWPEQKAVFHAYMQDQDLVHVILQDGRSKVLHISYIRV